MVRGSRRTGVTGSAFIRVLARLTDADFAESKPAFAERLSQWLSWTNAISLSSALAGNPVAPHDNARPRTGDDEGEFTRVRAALVRAITEDSAFKTDARRTDLHAAPDFATYRRRYLALQKAMEASIGPLRERLRATLASRSPAMARLAAVDAVMEQVLSTQERSLLSTVPALLEKHFKRLGQNDADMGTQPADWLDVFRKDAQSVLLAELDIRLQPAIGLLEALGTKQSGFHE